MKVKVLLPLPIALFSILCLFSVSILTGRVVGISDGDTITISSGKRSVKIRLHGIDCPEMGQAFGRRAKIFIDSLCLGKEVRVVVRGADKYGRVLGEVVLAEGTNLNHCMVREGLAWWYKKYSHDDTTLSRLQNQARTGRRGLWIQSNPVPPWVYRHGKVNAFSPDQQANPSCEYWLNTGSDVRHNTSCKWYRNTSRGRCCDSTEGKACQICGG